MEQSQSLLEKSNLQMEEQEDEIKKLNEVKVTLVGSTVNWGCEKNNN